MFSHKNETKNIVESMEKRIRLPVVSTGKCRTTHNACDCVLQRLEQLEAKNKRLREITKIKDPEQHFEQITEANNRLEAENERLKNNIELEIDQLQAAADLETGSVRRNIEATISRLERLLKGDE